MSLWIMEYGTLPLQWIVLGANISNIGTGGIWTILFHLGLGGKLIEWPPSNLISVT